MIYIISMLAAVLFGTISLVVNDFRITNDRSLMVPQKIKVVSTIFLGSLAFFVLLIPAATRYYVGIDYAAYNEFLIPNILLNNSKVEPLYQLFVKVAFFLGGSESYQSVFIFTHVLIIGFTMLFIFGQSRNPPISIFLFMGSTFYTFSLSGMRQSMAIAIFLYAIKYIKTDKWKQYYLLNIVAIGFHTSAIIFLPFYFIKRVKVSPWLVALLMPLNMIIAPVFRAILIFVTTKLNFYANYFGGQFDTGGFSISQVFENIFVLLIILIVYMIAKENVEKYRFEINVQLVLCLVISIISILPTPSRLIYLLLPVQIILLPNIISVVDNREIRIMLYLLIIVFFVAFFIQNVFVSNIYHTLPFQTYSF